MSSRPRSALFAALLLCLWIVPLTAAREHDLDCASGLGDGTDAERGLPAERVRCGRRADPGDAWAVGRFDAGGFDHPQPLAEHWDGSAWTSVAASWSEESELLGVAAVAPNDVWTVGGYQEGGSALIAHWNGSAITTVPHPNPGSFNRLYAVTAIAPNDVWAVGEFASGISRPLRCTGTARPGRRSRHRPAPATATSTASRRWRRTTSGRSVTTATRR